MTIFDTILGSVWQREGGKPAAALRRDFDWMTAQQRIRAERIRQSRMLFEGRHREYFIDEDRSSYEYRPIGLAKDKFYVAFNLLRLIALKAADLLFGEAPKITSDDESLQETVNEIAERSWLSATLPTAAVDCCTCGDTFLEISRVNGHAMIGHVPAHELWPIDVPGPDRQYAAYVRFATMEVDVPGFANKTETRLLETFYTRGKISRKVWLLGDNGAGHTKAKLRQLTLADWPARVGDQPLPEEESTGLSRVSIVYVPNDADAASDFDGLIGLQDSLNAKHTQLSRIFYQHSDPKMFFPGRPSSNEEGNVSSQDNAFFGDNKDSKPEYIEQNGEPEAAMKDRDFALMAIATASEFPLSLLGVKSDATAESATKMRLSASSALAKVARKAGFWSPAIRLAFAIAVEAETGQVVEPTFLAVEMKDGLPVDFAELADSITTLTTSRNMSRRRALQKQGLDESAVEAELMEIAKEDKQNMPSTLLGEPGGIDESGASSEVDGDGDVEGATDAGIATKTALNGAQGNAILEALGRFQQNAIGRRTAIEMLVGFGLNREIAELMVDDSGSRTGASANGISNAA